MTVYKVTKILRALWLAERSVCMRVCKHGCRVKIFCCFARYITQARFWKSFRVQNLTSFACGSWFHLSFGHFMTSFLWSIRVQIMENCGRFVNYISCNFFYLSVHSHGRNKLMFICWIPESEQPYMGWYVYSCWIEKSNQHLPSY